MERNGTARASLSEPEKRKHRCCFTGHRPEKLKCGETEARALLVEHIRSAYSHGFSTFITGIARGIDLWAAEIVLAEKAAHPDIHLIFPIQILRSLGA